MPGDRTRLHSDETEARTGPRRAAPVLAVLCAADFLVVLDGLIVAVALPSMQDALDISATSLQWVINAYILIFGGFLLLGGRLGDLYGRRRILNAGLVLFAAGALLAGTAWNSALLIAGRGVQGLGAALMAPTALALLVAAFPAGPARNRALGWWSAAGSIGIPAGALLGGLLTATLGWRWVLLVNVPAAALAALATRRVVQESYDRTTPQHLDVPGAVLITTGLAFLILAVISTEHLATSPGTASLQRIIAPLAAAVLLLVAFAAVQRRARSPLIPPRALRARGFLAANLVGATLPVGLGALLFIATLYLQHVLGYTPLDTGLAYLALALPVIAASPVASWLVTRTGRRPVAVLGLLLQTAGLVMIARVPVDGTFLTDVLPGFILVGLGAPTAFIPATAAALRTSRDDAGLASGIFNTAQQAGNALALAAMATVAAVGTAHLLSHGADATGALTAGYRAAFLLAAAITLAGAAAALTLLTRTASR